METETLRTVVELIGTLGGQTTTAFIAWVVLKSLTTLLITAMICGALYLAIREIVSGVCAAHNDTSALVTIGRALGVNLSEVVYCLSSHDRSRIVAAAIRGKDAR